MVSMDDDEKAEAAREYGRKLAEQHDVAAIMSQIKTDAAQTISIAILVDLLIRSDAIRRDDAIAKFKEFADDCLKLGSKEGVAVAETILSYFAGDPKDREKVS